MINQTVAVTFKNIGDQEFQPSPLSGTRPTSLQLLSEALALVEDDHELRLEGVILKTKDNIVYVFTSCGVIALDTEYVEYLGEESEVIRIDPC